MLKVDLLDLLYTDNYLVLYTLMNNYKDSKDRVIAVSNRSYYQGKQSLKHFSQETSGSVILGV